MKRKAKTIAVGLVTLTALLAGACNTIQGVGQDLESAGDAAEKVTKKHHHHHYH